MIETEHIYPTLGTYVSEMHAPVINGRPRERIVRCRDCVYCTPWVNDSPICNREPGEPMWTDPQGFCWKAVKR